MTAFNYRMNCDDYVLHEGDRPVRALTPEIAMAFAYDAQDGVWSLYKHGVPAVVHAWVAKNKRAQDGMDGLADGIHVIEGKLPVDDVNRCLQNAAYIETLVKKCLAFNEAPDYAAKTLRVDGVGITGNLALLKQIVSPRLESTPCQRISEARSPVQEVTDVEVKVRRPAP